MNNQVWLKQIDALGDILIRKGYKLVFETDAEDRVEFDEGHMTVYINSRNHPETRFYTLVHEIGHIIIGENWGAFESDNPMYCFSPERTDDARRHRSHAYRVSLISEEIEAWKRGRQFARSMGLFINDDKYDKHMTQNVMTYIEWAANE